MQNYIGGQTDLNVLDPRATEKANSMIEYLSVIWKLSYKENTIQAQVVSNTLTILFFFTENAYGLSSAYIINCNFWHFLKTIHFITKNCGLEISGFLPVAKGKQPKGHWACLMGYDHHI